MYEAPVDESLCEQSDASLALSAAFGAAESDREAALAQSPWRIMVVAEYRASDQSEWRLLTRLRCENETENVYGEWRDTLYYGGDDFAPTVQAPAVCVKLFSRNALVSGSVAPLDFWRQLQFWPSHFGGADETQENETEPAVRCATADALHRLGCERGMPLDAADETMHFYSMQFCSDKYYATSQASFCTLAELRDAGYEERWRSEFRQFAKVIKDMRRRADVPRSSVNPNEEDRSAIRLVYWLYWPSELRHMDIANDAYFGHLEQHADQEDEQTHREAVHKEAVSAFARYFREEMSDSSTEQADNESQSRVLSECTPRSNSGLSTPILEALLRYESDGEVLSESLSESSSEMPGLVPESVDESEKSESLLRPIFAQRTVDSPHPLCCTFHVQNDKESLTSDESTTSSSDGTDTNETLAAAVLDEFRTKRSVSFCDDRLVCVLERQQSMHDGSESSDEYEYESDDESDAQSGDSDSTTASYTDSATEDGSPHRGAFAKLRHAIKAFIDMDDESSASYESSADSTGISSTESSSDSSSSDSSSSETSSSDSSSDEYSDSYESSASYSDESTNSSTEESGSEISEIITSETINSESSSEESSGSVLSLSTTGVDEYSPIIYRNEYGCYTSEKFADHSPPNHITIDLRNYIDPPTVNCYVQSEEHQALYVDPLTGNQEISFDCLHFGESDAHGWISNAGSALPELLADNAEDDASDPSAREYDALLTEATELALSETRRCAIDDEANALIDESITSDWYTLVGAVEGTTFLVVGTQETERDAFYHWLTRSTYFPSQRTIDGSAMPLNDCLRLAQDIERAPAGRALVRITDANSATSALARFVRNETDAATFIDLSRNLAHYAPRMRWYDFSFLVLTASATFADFEEALHMMSKALEYTEAEKRAVFARWHFCNRYSPLVKMERGDALVVPLNHHMRLHGFNEPKLLRGIV